MRSSRGGRQLWPVAPKQRVFASRDCRVMMSMLNWLFFLVLAVWILDSEDKRGTHERSLRLIKPS